jgi:hypothetical protein
VFGQYSEINMEVTRRPDQLRQTCSADSSWSLSGETEVILETNNWTSRRGQPFLAEIMERLPVIRPESLVNIKELPVL